MAVGDLAFYYTLYLWFQHMPPLFLQRQGTTLCAGTQAQQLFFLKNLHPPLKISGSAHGCCIIAQVWPWSNRYSRSMHSVSRREACWHAHKTMWSQLWHQPLLTKQGRVFFIYFCTNLFCRLRVVEASAFQFSVTIARTKMSNNSLKK